MTEIRYQVFNSLSSRVLHYDFLRCLYEILGLGVVLIDVVIEKLLNNIHYIFLACSKACCFWPASQSLGDGSIAIKDAQETQK